MIVGRYEPAIGSSLIIFPHDVATPPAAQKGPAARRRPKAAREAYSLCGLSVRPRAPTKQMGPFQPPVLEVQHFGGVFPDILDAAVGDRGGLHRCHQMAPAQRRAGGVELLVGRLVMLEGVHLAEVVAAGDLAE